MTICDVRKVARFEENRTHAFVVAQNRRPDKKSAPTPGDNPHISKRYIVMMRAEV